MADHKPNDDSTNSDSQDAAVNLIRARIEAVYGKEPSAKAEIKEIKEADKPLSKHQKYMHELTNSGKSLAEIQTAWHTYYVNLSDAQKHEVWQEFYENSKQTPKNKPSDQSKVIDHPKKETHVYHNPEVPKEPPRKSVAHLKKQITRSVTANQKAKLSAKQHFKSLLFGVSMGAVVLIILLFGFFNERFVTPFMTPSKNVSSTPIIIDPASTAVGPESKVIIPKINVEVPVVYDINSIQEKDIQHALERGVVHYSTTSSPGEKGNSVIVGHSSNNIFNGGKYKFAFVLLSKLEAGDTFILTQNGKRYVYRIYEKRIVKPTDISVLGNTDRPATATLITCDPPGTSINRLVVFGEQISPDPNTNVASTAVASNDTQPAIVPGNSPSLWSRLRDWLTG